MIENIELLAFVRENLALARTIVIKNEDLAILDNANMLKYSDIDSGTDKSKWRYYLNLNGEYHFTDEIMIVKSLDDNELIDFTKKNLEDHPATKKAYRLGGYYFSRLVAQYPHQMELIQGIINPIPPEESIPAKNYQILRYTKEYIEWNEFQLIPKLQDFINQTVYQSFNTEYKDTDDLLLPVLIAHLSEGTYKFLLECRFEHRYSRNAHSFYIWSFLQSKGISPIYKDLLNNKQTMWLFRNIDYVLRNLGKSGTFKELIEILLTERNIPLAKYDLIQSTESMAKDLHSEPLFFSERLNLIETRGLGQQTNKIARTMLKEIPESLDNEIYYDKFLPVTTAESTYGEQTTYPTKILDSELVDTTNRKPETIYNLLNNELIYLAGNGLYNINLDIEDPLSGIHQRISVKDAIVLWHHLLNKFNGADCDSIPSFYYREVLKITPPTIETMQSVGAKPFLNENWCRDVLNTYIPQIRMVSPSVFYENALAVFNLKWDHVKMYSRWLSIGYYSRRKNAISTMYETGFIKLTDKKTYSEFLEQYDFDFSSYNKEDYFSLMWEIWRKMTGWDQFSHITIGQIQDGMIGLMKFLSSYNVQYIHQTTMEEGWYEGGLDLMTENPGLLHPDGDGQLELETDVESNRIPIHHRVVMTAEEEETLYLDNRLDHGTIEAEMAMTAEVFETPNLYNVELDDTDKDDGFHSSQVMDFDHKLRLFTGKLPYELEDLIPDGGTRAGDHTLKEMIVDSFDGIQQVGPWKAKGIWIVNNKGLDNQAVAEDVDGYDYAKIVDVKEVKKDGETYNRYYVGFVPALIGENVIKLDIVAEHEDSGESMHVRFDYNTESKKNTWALSLEIPESVQLNTPFPITPTITGLTLTGLEIVKEQYSVHADIAEYIEIDDKDGVVSGTFLKKGWPEILPVMYTLLVSNGDEDELLSRHYYYMLGYVPSDRYYDPLTDPEFEPKGTYFEGDANALTLERFTLTASNKGWEPVEISLKMNEDGSYPTNLVKTDYEGIVNFLAPRTIKYEDAEIKGKTVRTFEWLYGAAATGITIPLVLKLQNTEGEVVYRDFEYKPEIINHGINASFDIYPESGFKFGIKHSTTTKLTVDGLPDTVTLLSGGVPTGFPNQGSIIEIDYDPEQGVENNVALGYSVRPQNLIEQDFRWAIQVEATTKARNGRDLTIKPYGMFTIPQSDVVDYDIIDIKDIRIKGWENSTIRAHAIVPSRYSISDLSNGWQLEGIEITKTNGYYPEFVGKELPGVNASNGITGFSPVIKMGVGTDGAQTVPAGYDRWFTIYMLGNRDYLGEGYQELDIPVTATMKSKYTGNTKVVQLTLKNGFSGQAFASTRNPDEIVASTNNHILPSWKNLPLRDFGDDATLISSEGLFIGADKYLGGAGYKEQTECIWNSDQTANIILPTAPISDGQGIKIYNKRIYKSNDARFANSSVEEVVYYPFVEYSKSEIIRVPPPTLEDFDFTNLDNVEFFQGVRSSYVSLYNAAKVYEKGWTVKSVDLEILGTDEQDNYIQTSINGKDLKSNMYTSGVQNNSVHDTPTGKTKYAAAYVGFVPVLTGKQKFGVIVTVACNSISIPTRSYRYEIEIDVQEREGEIIFDTSYPDPWWVLGKETFVLTELKGYTGNVSQKRMLLGTINDEDKQYASVRAAVNASLSSGIALAVTVPDRFTGVTPKAIVGHSIFLNGYLTADARRTRYYFGTLPIRSDRLYNIDEINLETIEFTPDVVFDSMDVNQSYTERYMYNINTRGWYINTIRVQDESDWMNHYFEYGEKLVTDSSLFNVSAQNVTKDKTITAPTGKTYYLPMYGSRKIGNFSVKINILLSNKHHSSNAGINLVYEADREIVESNIKLNLGYEAIYIGKNNLLTGDFEGIPTSDIHEGMVANVSKYSVIAEKDSYFQFSGNPYAVDIKSGYPEGSGSGIKLTASVVYGNVAPNKVLESATWIRGYRGEQFISEDSIIKPINYPAIEDFDFTLFKSNLIQGASSCLLYAYKPLGRSDEGWVSSDIGLSVYGTPDESEVMIRKIGDYDIPETYVHTVITGPSGIRLPELPDDKPYAEYANHSLRFIPAKSGKQKLEIVFTVRSTSNPKISSKQYVFPIEVDVAENGAYVGRKPGTEDIKLLIGDATKVEVALVGNVPDAVTSSRSVKATPVGENINDYIFTTNYDTFISTSIVKGFDDTKNIAMIMQSTFKDVDGIFINNDQRATVYYINMLPIEPALLYSLDEINAGFINFIPEITTPVMARNQSYCERFIYDAESRGWSVSEMGLVPDNSWMNHYFEYEGVSTTNAQLLSQGNARIRYDRNITAPDGKYYFLPFYGGRIEGEFTVGVNVTVTNSVHTKNKRYTFRIEFDRKIVEEGIGVTLSYDKLYLGETVRYQESYTNVPTSDLKTGVISSNTLYKILGPDASHFKMDTSKGTITVDNSYPLGDGKGALVTIVRPYKATRAGNNIDSETYFRAYRTEYLIPDSDIVLNPAMFNIRQLGLFWRELESTAVPIYVTQPSNGWKIREIRLKVEEMDDYILKEYKGISTLGPEFCNLSKEIDDYLKNEEIIEVDFSFIPKAKGIFNYPAELVVAKENITSKIPFTVRMEVKERLPEMGYIDFYRNRNIGRLPISAKHPLVVNEDERIYGSPKGYDRDEQIFISSTNSLIIINGNETLLKVSVLDKSPVFGYVFNINPRKPSVNGDSYISYYLGSYDIGMYGEISNPSNIKKVERKMLMENSFNKGEIIDSGGYELKLIGNNVSSVNNYYAEFNFALYKNGSPSSDSINRKYGSVGFSTEDEFKTTGLNSREYTSGGGSRIDILPVTSEYPDLKDSYFRWSITGIVEVTDNKGMIYPVYFFYEGKYSK